MTGFASALTDIPLIALVQQRIPDRHLAMALGLWEAGIAGALAIAPFVAAAVIEHTGVRNAFMLSGAALISLAAIAAITVTRVTARSVRRPPPRRSAPLARGRPRRLATLPRGRARARAPLPPIRPSTVARGREPVHGSAMPRARRRT